MITCIKNSGHMRDVVSGRSESKCWAFEALTPSECNCAVAAQNHGKNASTA